MAEFSKSDPSLLQSANMTESGDRFNRVLFSALDALEQKRIPYALIGGVASSGLGRPRSTHDIDIFVRPEDAGAALNALSASGFLTEKTDINWLFKGYKEDIMVDIIFKSKGDLYLDDEMARRARPVLYHGRLVKAVSPEDLVIIKCAVHDEGGSHHWHDALAILSHASLDWDYLLQRSRRASRKLMSLLIYAQANDIWIPNRVIYELFKTIYQGGEQPEHEVPRIRSSGHPMVAAPTADTYLAGKIKEVLVRDPRTSEQDIKVYVEQGRVLLKGEAQSETKRSTIEKVVREVAPHHAIDNQINVSELREPEGTEAVG